LDAVALRAAGAEALAPVAPGEGVLAAGTDAQAGQVLCRAGTAVRAIDVAALQALGIARVMARAPRLAITYVRHAPGLAAAATLLCHAATAAGVTAAAGGAVQAGALDQQLLGGDADAVIVVGGTGSGPNDHSVATLARVGRVEVHGMAIAPGETAAFGLVG